MPRSRHPQKASEEVIETSKARIEKAKALLQMPDSLIYHVADAVGFRDATYFSTIFKKYMGISP